MDVNDTTLLTQQRAGAIQKIISFCEKHSASGADLIEHLFEGIKAFDHLDSSLAIQQATEQGLFVTFPDDNVLYCLTDSTPEYDYPQLAWYLAEECNDIVFNDFGETEPEMPGMEGKLIRLWMTALGIEPSFLRNQSALVAPILYNTIYYGILGDLQFVETKKLVRPQRCDADGLYVCNEFLEKLSLSCLLYTDAKRVLEAYKQDIQANLDCMDISNYYVATYSLYAMLETCIGRS